MLGSNDLLVPLGNSKPSLCEGENNVLMNAWTLTSLTGERDTEVLGVPKGPTPQAIALPPSPLLQVPPSYPQVHCPVEIRPRRRGLWGVLKATSIGHLLFLTAAGEAVTESYSHLDLPEITRR